MKIKIIIALVIFSMAGLSAFVSNKYYKSQYKLQACPFVDIENPIFTDYKDSDPEFDGMTKGDDGLFQPIRDKSGKIIKDLPGGYPGTKTLHIPFIRGFKHGEDGSRQPCREAVTKEEKEICNNKELYLTGYNATMPIEDLDKIYKSENSLGKSY